MVLRSRGGQGGRWAVALGPEPAPPQVTFSFEAGRRCASGEGSFEFDTRQGNEIFQAIEVAIGRHRARAAQQPRRGAPGDDASWPLAHARSPSWAQGHEEPPGAKCPSSEPGWEGKVTKAKPAMPPSSCPGAGEPPGTFLPARGADAPCAEPCGSLRRAVPLVPGKSWKQEAAAKAGDELAYATPFDTIAKTFLAQQLGSLCQPDPVYDSIGEAEGQEGAQPPPPPTAAKPKPYHIYDEPEGLSAHSVYDQPQEVKGDAWKLQAAPEEPSGHQHPYSPQQDGYAVPRRPIQLRQPPPLQGTEWLRDGDYDNVALKLAKRRDVQ